MLLMKLDISKFNFKYRMLTNWGTHAASMAIHSYGFTHFIVTFSYTTKRNSKTNTTYGLGLIAKMVSYRPLVIWTSRTALGYSHHLVQITYTIASKRKNLCFFLLNIFVLGTSEAPSQTSRRFIVVIILLLGFSMFQFYSASIVGSLLMQKPKTIKTLRNLIDSSLKIGIEDIVYNKDFFKVSVFFKSISWFI